MDGPSDKTKCHVMVRVLRFLEDNPAAYERLTLFLDDCRFLITIDELAERTRWSKSYIYKLCEANKLPHIPGSPLKFVWDDVMKSIKKMQRGGSFQRRQTAKKKFPKVVNQ